MDIISTIGDCTAYTFHSHTEFCDGHAAMADFAKEAASRGFVHYGFSPHSPIPFDSPCNMSKESVPQYLTEVKRQQEQYPDVKFYAGMEIDFLGPDWGPANQYFQELPLDYRIGSMHFIRNQQGEFVDIDGRFETFKEKMRVKFHDDIRYVVDEFFAASQQMVAAGGFDIIGHFDKIKHNAGLYQPGLEDEPWYKSQVQDLIDSIVASGVIVEINTKAWHQHQQLFPSQKHWRQLLKAGVPIIVNSDCHHPDKIDDGRREALSALNYLKTHL